MPAALERKLLPGNVVREKNRFLQVPVVGTKTICRFEGLSLNKS